MAEATEREGGPVMRARRILLVLPVLLGVLAMHGLAGGDHRSAGHLAATTASQPHAMLAMSGASAVGPLSELPQSAGDEGVAALRSVVGPGSTSDHMLMCLAVLAAALALVLPAVLPVRPSDRDGVAVPQPSTRSPSRAPPRALLAQICVLRT